jgi:hypothetical protein
MAVVILIPMGERIGGSVVSSSAEGQSPRFGVQFCCESNDESQANSPREWREWRQGGRQGPSLHRTVCPGQRPGPPHPGLGCLGCQWLKFLISHFVVRRGTGRVIEQGRWGLKQDGEPSLFGRKAEKTGLDCAWRTGYSPADFVVGGFFYCFGSVGVQ